MKKRQVVLFVVLIEDFTLYAEIEPINERKGVIKGGNYFPRELEVYLPEGFTWKIAEIKYNRHSLETLITPGDLII